MATPTRVAAPAPALSFLACLTEGGPADDLTIQTFDDEKTNGASRPRLAGIIHGPLVDSHEDLVHLNERGAGVFVAVNQTDLHGRTKANVVALRGWWADLDTKDASEALDLERLALAPSMVVRTPGGWHLYWLAASPMPCGDDLRRDEHEAEVKGIAQSLKAFGGDTKACDVARVLRVPGYLHRKAAPRLVELVRVNGPRYTREQIREAFPPMEKKPKAEVRPAPVSRHQVAPSRADVMRRAGAYLAACAPGIQGSDGSGATFNAALKVITRFNLTEDEALSLLCGDFNARCEPAWSEAELAHKVAGAWAQAQHSPDLGSSLDARPARGSEDQAAAMDETHPDSGDRPQVKGFEWGARGLLHLKSAGKDSEGNEKPPDQVWIAPPFALPGLVRDMDSQGWRLLISWNDLDQIHHEEAVPFDLLSGEGTDLARTLAQGGMMLSPDPAPRKALLRYLCGAAPKLSLRVRLVESLGWHEGAFVLPDGKTVGQAGEALRFAGEGSALHRHATSGTMEGWQSQVAAYAVGEPRLAFGIACAFAGPLLALVRPDGGGGFNLQGFSSKGKSTVLEAAASVWHCPAPLPTWRATANGLEGIAATRNDGFLPLDEMGQVDAKEAGQVAYMLANGSAKVRATKDGGTRALKQWRVIFLSTGELGIEDKLSEDGKRAKAGQEVRVPDIPCPAAGMLEDTHGFPSLGAFAEHLKASARKHYGHAARAFLAGLCDEWGRRDELQASLRAMEAEWMAATIPPGVDAQVRRVGGRFALVAVAGELAQRMGVLPWPEGESFRAAAVCFGAWLDRRGFSGASESHGGIGAVLAFLEKHGMSRFDEWGDREARPFNRAGTRRRAEGMENGWDFFITPEAWKEACQGSSARDVARACADAGILEVDAQGKFSLPVTLPGHGRVRCYIIRAYARDQFQGGESE